MESDLGSPGKTRKLMIWTSWPADCLASWLAGWRSLVKPGFGSGEVFGVSVKGVFLMENDLGSPGKTRKLMIWIG